MQDKHRLCLELWGTNPRGLEGDIRVVTFEETEDERDWAVGRARGNFSGRETGKGLKTERTGLEDSRVSAHLAGVLDAFRAETQSWAAPRHSPDRSPGVGVVGLGPEEILLLNSHACSFGGLGGV